MKAAYTEDRPQTPLTQEVGRQVLFTLAGQHQTDLDELVLVAVAFGLEASAVAEAIAADGQPDQFELALAG